MKYIITEEKMTSLIRHYLDKSFGDLNWEYIDADYEEGEDTDCGVVFYKGDYSDLKKKFRLYEECWWVDGEYDRMDKSPIVIFENKSDYDSLELILEISGSEFSKIGFLKNLDLKSKQ